VHLHVHHPLVRQLRLLLLSIVRFSLQPSVVQMEEQKASSNLPGRPAKQYSGTEVLNGFRTSFGRTECLLHMAVKSAVRRLYFDHILQDY
jgi:hypothetical protein